jgi:hypothetical protein
MGYIYASSYTPRHLRRRGNTRRNGSGQEEKSQMFRLIAVKSKKFIFQKAGQLEKEGPLNREYAVYRAKSAKGNGFR